MNNQEKNFKVEQRPLGSQGLVVSCQGLGTMGMTAFYDTQGVSEEEKIACIGKALEIGVNFFDTAWIYQNFQTGEKNEELLGLAIKKYGRENFVIATKTGIGFDNGLVVNNKPELIRKQCEESLKRLGIDCIDLYYLHRIDPNTPFEESLKTMEELIKEGKIKYVGLSECTAQELEKAHKVFPISAIQMEWSLQTRDIEKEIVPKARELGVGIVAYSPLCRGLLSRKFVKKDDLSKDDFRNNIPRFSGENFDKNLIYDENLEKYAQTKGYTAGQLALAWVHSRGKDVFPIPGTKSEKRLTENALSSNIKLSDEETKELEEIVPEGKGDRYDSQQMQRTFNGRLNLKPDEV